MEEPEKATLTTSTTTTDGLQALISLLGENTSKLELTLDHTIYLCCYLNKTLFDCIRLKNEIPDLIGNGFKEYYKATIRFCAELIAKHPNLISIQGNENFPRDFTIWLTANLLHIAALDANRCLESEPVECCNAVLRSLSIEQRSAVLEEVILLHHDLGSFNEKFVEDVPMRFTLFSDSFRSLALEMNGQFSLSSEELVIPDLFITLRQCERMQFETCVLLIKCFKMRLMNVSKKSLLIVWDALFRQLELSGDLDLKEQCTILCTILLEQNYYVNGATKFTLDLILALIAFLCDNCIESQNSFDGLIVAISQFLACFSRLLFSAIDGDKSAFLQENEMFYERILSRCLRLYKRHENDSLNSLVQTKLCDFMVGVTLYLRLHCHKSNSQILNRFKALSKGFFETLLKCGDNYDFKPVTALSRELALLFYMCSEDLDTQGPLTLLQKFIDLSCDKIGNVKNVQEILNIFLIATDVVDCLIKTTSCQKHKQFFWKYLHGFIERFVDAKCNCFINALEYCQKIADQDLANTVYNSILQICCICTTHLSTRVHEDGVNELLNRCIDAMGTKWIKSNMLCDGQQGSVSDEVDESFIRYCGQVARVCSNEAYLSVVIRLSMTASEFAPERLIKVAADELAAVAAFRRITLRELYIEVAAELMQLLVRRLIGNLRDSASSNQRAHVIDEKLAGLIKIKISRLCIAFDFVNDVKYQCPDFVAWCHLSERYLIPFLMLYHCVEATRVHKALASVLRTTRYLLISQNLPHILLQLATSNVGNEEAREIISFIESECTNSCGQFLQGAEHEVRERITFSKLIADNSFRCISALVTNLATPDLDDSYIFNVMYRVCTICADEAIRDFKIDQCKKQDSIRPEVLQSMNSRFFGLLISFEDKLRFTIPRKEKTLAIRSFSRFISFAEPTILGQAALKALSILMYANDMLSNERFATDEFLNAITEAWLTFVKRLPVEHLHKLCLQILVSLTGIPTQNIFEQMLKLCLKERSWDLRDRLNDFIFLISCPHFDSIRQRTSSDLILQLSDYCQSDAGPMDVRQELNHILAISRNESCDVKCACLSRTLYCLQKRVMDIYRLVFETDKIDSAVLGMIDFLLHCLRHSEQKVRRLSAVCFGELGAIDPGRFRIEADFVRESAKFETSTIDFDDLNSSVIFGCRLLTELNKYLIASTDGSTFNVFSYVLQEVLKFFELNTEKRSEKGSGAELIWSSLSDDVRSSLTPSLTTMYVIHRRKNTSLIVYPLFGNNEVTTFQQWLAKFIGDLFNKINHPNGKEFFESLEIAALTDTNFARFILPHVVLQKLKEQDDAYADVILNEIKHILTCDSLADTGEFTNQITQEIFSLLDFLTRWSYKGRPPAVEKQLERRRIECFLREIPLTVMGDCAIRHQAYTRALMYYEAHINEHVAKQNASNKREGMLQYLEQLQEIYAHLGDVDSVVGVLDIRKSKGHPSPKEEVLALECTGNYAEALPFHELLLIQQPEKLENHKALIKCLLRLNQSNLALRYLDGFTKTRPELENKMRPYKIETLCKLEDWDTLNSELEKTGDLNTWGRTVADLLQTSKKNDDELFARKVDIVRRDIVRRLQTVVLGSSAYDRAYKYVLRLHMVSEIAGGVKAFSAPTEALDAKNPQELIDIWDKRFDSLQASPDVLNCVLETRRQLWSIFAKRPNNDADLISNNINKSWLQSLQIARKSGHLQSAINLLAKVKALNIPEAFEEEAKILWLKGEKDSATNCLLRGINENYKKFLNNETKAAVSTPVEQRIAFAKAQLRMANYARESLSHEFDDITQMYKLALNACPEFEDAHYYLAIHFDQLESSRANFKTQDWCAFRLAVLESYGTGLRHGSKFLHHALPRILTLWLDASSRLTCSVNGNVVETTAPASKSITAAANRAENLKLFNSLLLTFGQSLPVYQLYSSFSQLVSRVPHPCLETTEVLKEMIARTILTYGQQCLWMSVAVSRSSVIKRREIFDEIFKLVGKRNPSFTKLINDFHKLRDLLQNICFHKDNRSIPLKMKERFPELFCLFEDKKFSRIMMPLQSLMDVTLPLPLNDKAPNEFFDPFPNTCIFIESFDNIVEVFPTLQRPKKMGMRGSDGKPYSVLCKPKDDLRVDKRVMEFASLVNVFLLRYPDTRRRQLKIRTYAVVPLSEDFGLLEWVPNLEAIRSVLLAIYRERGTGLSNDKLRDLCHKSKPDSEKLDIFLNKLLPNYPSVFSLWLRRTFIDPISWYNARNNYVHTAAVMSVVGFVLGLGDRHLENILIDKVMGDLVHVDFNCLFNRGEELEVPELVPFRLTHNMVEAMGPLGHEGPFSASSCKVIITKEQAELLHTGLDSTNLVLTNKVLPHVIKKVWTYMFQYHVKTCEATMRVLRNEKETLRTVLETFLYDPLVEWRKHDEKIKQQQINNRQGVTNALEQGQSKQNRQIVNDSVSDKAQQHLKNIDFRLSGCVASRGNDYGTPLSIEGQINNLIRQAVDKKLLSKMYVGWAPYM